MTNYKNGEYKAATRQMELKQAWYDNILMGHN